MEMLLFRGWKCMYFTHFSYVNAPSVIILYHIQTIIKVDPKSHRYIHGDHKKDKMHLQWGGSWVYGSELS